MPREALIRAAADVIESHIDGSFKRRERAVSNAYGLADSGVLGMGTREQAVNVLQCRHEWKIAEQIADALWAAGLIKE